MFPIFDRRNTDQIYRNMKLTDKCLEILRKSRQLKTLLALEMDKSVHTIELWISSKSDNLTKAAALKVIREVTNLSEEEILEVEVYK